jgi:phosphorylcholine metabolism protein LicD
MTKKNVLLKKFSLESLRSQFLEIIDLLNARGVNYYLVGGALLGIVRSGDLLPWDRDTDLFVKYEDLNEFLHVVDELKNSGWRCNVETFSENCAFANSSDPRVIKISDSWLSAFRGPTRMDVDIIYPMDSYMCWNAARRYSRIDKIFLKVMRLLIGIVANLKFQNFTRIF